MEVKDYTEEPEYTHYQGVKSWYGKNVDEECRMQPRYCDPGKIGSEMRGEVRNVQTGPDI